MKSFELLAVVVLLAGVQPALFGQRGPAAGSGMGTGTGSGCCCGRMSSPIAGSPVIDVKGQITKVQLTPGAGMPSIEVHEGSQLTTIYLGSMRYLMSQGFNPSAGENVVVKAYKTADAVIAISVTLVAQNKTIQLRDENGFPMWRGCRR